MILIRVEIIGAAVTGVWYPVTIGVLAKTSGSCSADKTVASCAIRTAIAQFRHLETVSYMYVCVCMVYLYIGIQ